jgi:ligand-binding sensor domain-containing protein
MILLSEGYAFGQVDEYNFTRIDVNQGLSHNMVQCIYRDSKGFLWFGTNSGLNRYDGYSFKVFKHIPSDTNSIPDNRIRDIFEDPFGLLWISLWDSYIIYDPENDRFSSDNPIFHKNLEIPSALISRIRQDNAGNIWFICDQDGIYLYLASADSIIHLTHTINDSLSIQDGAISSVCIDSQKNFWIIGFNGLLEKIDGRKLYCHLSFILIAGKYQ